MNKWNKNLKYGNENNHSAHNAEEFGRRHLAIWRSTTYSWKLSQ